MKGEGYFPATINAMHTAGADRIFILGGVPAMALMAFGMGVMEPVDILCGAGNQYVAEAKRQLFGRCGIDLLAGPTEIMVIADDSADPALVACDLLGQAEHDPHSGVALVCLSERFGRECLAEVERQLEVLPTREIARQSWVANGRVYVADGREEAVALSDDYAPEHLELHVEDQDYYFERLTNYGSLLIRSRRRSWKPTSRADACKGRSSSNSSWEKSRRVGWPPCTKSRRRSFSSPARRRAW